MVTCISSIRRFFHDRFAASSYGKVFALSLQLLALLCLTTRLVDCAKTSLENERAELASLPSGATAALFHPSFNGGRNFIEDENDEDVIDMEQKRAQWNNLQGGWGKRADNWNKLSAAWGKREQGPAAGRWNNLSAMWGKRESPNWNKLRGMWGK